MSARRLADLLDVQIRVHGYDGIERDIHERSENGWARLFIYGRRMLFSALPEAPAAAVHRSCRVRRWMRNPKNGTADAIPF